MTSGVVIHVSRSICARCADATKLLMALLLIAVVISSGCDAIPSSLFSGAGGRQADGSPEAPGIAQNDAGADADLGEGTTDGIARDIEEADIVKIAGDMVYALNRFKGLLIIDASDPDAPALIGELELRGRGVEMYVVGSQVYILLSADFHFGYLGGVGMAQEMGEGSDGPIPPTPDFDGSRLAIVDATDPTAPTLQSKINLVGFANESRRVGDVIYAIGHNIIPPPYGRVEDDDFAEGFVASINVADPDDIIPVTRETFSGNALVMHVTERAIFAAGQAYDFDTGDMNTTIQVIDISDPDGAITMRGTVDVPGHIRNRFYLDDYEDVLRIATESWGFGFNEVRLFTYDSTDLDAITALGETQIIQGETLQAVRFDGPRGYVVTFLQIDPLFVVDLRDPASPAVTGHLEVPGFSTHIEPRGNRLIAVGIDDTNGRRPAVSYYDVEDPTNPIELGRVILGPPGSFTQSEATYDEKAFKIIDELGLIAIPFKHVDYGNWPMPADDVGTVVDSDGDDGNGGVSAEEILPDDEPYRPSCMNAVQLVDYDDDGLTQRGWFEHRGLVRRVGVVGGRVFALSQAAFQTVDISDRDNPAQAGAVDFFSEDDMPFFADDCYGWVMPLDWDRGINISGDTLAALIELFMDGDLCGTISVMPAVALPFGFWMLMKPHRTKRQRRAR